ncbi:DUF1062 domain-containing protein [Agrobacterium deltaense]|uniref:DUF1062 domain-containing protein n=1 Tax=Agrobacterium deltaense TaxID=1183412 RepID=UPI001CB78A47|nr:DUF1062 domain-containing protein [Agrobacterium deltaense]
MKPPPLKDVCPAYGRRNLPFPTAANRRKIRPQRVDEFPEFDIAKQIRDDPPDWAMAEIDLMVPLQAGIRLERLLASELGLSRSMLQKLQDDGSLRAQSERSDLLRRRVKNGTRIVIARCGGFDPVHLWKPVTADF